MTKDIKARCETDHHRHPVFREEIQIVMERERGQQFLQVPALQENRIGQRVLAYKKTDSARNDRRANAGQHQNT